MKIVDKKLNKEDGSIDVKLCLCQGRSTCRPDQKLSRHFKSKLTFDAFKRAFNLR
jgi:hypothetical protein